MQRRTFLKQLGVGTIALLGRASLAASRPPNIVFVLIDDMGYADVGCFGSSLHETPNIDRLAAEGMRFTQGYAACPVCSPTRASIMTGKYPARLKLTDFLKGLRSPEDSPILPAPYADELALEEVTLAEALGGAGYATAIVGKWHLGREQFGPEHQGFETAIGVSPGGAPRSHFWPQWQENPPMVGKSEHEYLADRLTDEACAYIREKRDRPFFLYLAHYSVHIPIEAKAEKIAKYEAKLKAHPPEPGRQDNAYYAAMVESVDESIGKVMAALRESGIDDNTVVVFFSDNGGLSVKEGAHTPATSNYPFRAGKGYLYEGGVREPLIVRWPGVTKAGAVCDTPVCSIDFFPTLCAAAGVDGGRLKTNGPIDGASFAPLLRGETFSPHDAIYWHYPHFSNQGGRPGGAVRAGAWKLIEFFEDDKLELYNLDTDPGEQHDLAHAHPEKVEELHQRLKQWRVDTGATMPPPNPRYKRPA